MKRITIMALLLTQAYLLCSAQEIPYVLPDSVTEKLERLSTLVSRRSRRDKKGQEKYIGSLFIKKGQDDEILICPDFVDKSIETASFFYNRSQRTIIFGTHKLPVCFDYDNQFVTTSDKEELAPVPESRQYWVLFLMNHSDGYAIPKDYFATSISCENSLLSSGKSDDIIYILNSEFERELIDSLNGSITPIVAFYLEMNYYREGKLMALTETGVPDRFRNGARKLLIADKLYPLVFDYDRILGGWTTPIDEKSIIFGFSFHIDKSRMDSYNPKRL